MVRSATPLQQVTLSILTSISESPHARPCISTNTVQTLQSEKVLSSFAETARGDQNAQGNIVCAVKYRRGFERSARNVSKRTSNPPKYNVD
uniref:Secreted protein n=1 Tax=Ascaris lumbricoides TaxID=6252 RepID=A0A0M3HXN9_ASCLU